VVPIHESEKSMRLKAIVYWGTTCFVALILGLSGGMSVLHAAPLMKGLKHLGYPEYFANILGAGKMIGLVVFVAPGMPRFKEWAYAGFSITVLSACYSHFCSGDGLLALEPLLTFAALIASYFTRPAGRTIARPLSAL
jgi:hypothetical protein